MKVGTKGYLTYKDSSTAEVEIIHQTDNPQVGNINWFKYAEGEENKQLKCTNKFKDEAVFSLTDEMAGKVFTTYSEKDLEKKAEEAYNKSLEEMGTRVSKGTVPAGFEDCDTVYRATPKGSTYQIHIGVDNAKSRYFVQFGSNEVMNLSKDRFIEMMAGASALGSGALIGQGYSPQQVQNMYAKKLDDMNLEQMEAAHGELYEPEKKVVKGHGGDELRESIDQATKEHSDEADAAHDAAGSEKMRDIQKEMEEMEALRADFAETTKDMDEEEKEQYENELSKKEIALQEEEASEFEKQLLGTIEVEQEKTYDFAYFLNIHKTQGAAALKEELTKLAKDDRPAMIEKIKEEYRQMKLKEQSGTDEKTTEENS